MEFVERAELNRFADVCSSIHLMDHHLVRVEFVVAMCAADAPMSMLSEFDQYCADPCELFSSRSDCAFQKRNGIVSLMEGFRSSSHLSVWSALMDAIRQYVQGIERGRMDARSTNGGRMLWPSVSPPPPPPAPLHLLQGSWPISRRHEVGKLFGFHPCLNT
jgi:hypothetical protein